MKMIFVNDIPYPLTALPGTPAALSLRLLPGAIVQYVNGFFGKLYIQYIKTVDFAVCYTVARIKTGCKIRLPGKQGCLRLHILVKNGAVHTSNHTGNTLLYEGQANLYDPHQLDWCFETVNGTEYIHLDIFYSSRIVKQFLSCPPGGQLFDQPVFLPYGQQEIIDSLLYCPLPGNLCNHFRKIKVLELLILLLGARSGETHTVHTGIDPGKWYGIKQLIADHLQQHHTISMIARKFCINTTALKKEFQQRFGYGPFAFLTKLRMTKALELLQNSPCSIAEIADRVGYRNPGSFTKAFRKHFGHTPGKTRKHL